MVTGKKEEEKKKKEKGMCGPIIRTGWRSRP
jgi:hypothetical protein